MKVVLSSTLKSVVVADKADIGSGGEAGVHSITGVGGMVAKIYHDRSKVPVDKLRAMLANSPTDDAAAGHSSIAWPRELVLDEKTGAPIGYVMPRLKGMHKLFEYYNPKSRRGLSPQFNYLYLTRTARNLAAAVRAIHSKGHVIGDVNESNILVAETALVTLVDTDSFQIRDLGGNVFRCPVGKAEFTPPELQGQAFSKVDRSQASDLFGLAVLIFQLLMEGTHPFAGRYVGSGEDPLILPADRIKAQVFPHSSRAHLYQPVATAPSVTNLSPLLRSLLFRCFEEGLSNPAARPSASEWVTALERAEASLATCRQNHNHRYDSLLGACPWCDRKRSIGIDAFPPNGQAQHALPKASTRPTPPAKKFISPLPIVPPTNRQIRRRRFPLWWAGTALGSFALILWGANELSNPDTEYVFPPTASITAPTPSVASLPDPFDAATNGDSASLKAFIEKGGDVNAAGGYMEVTPLHYASLMGQANCVRLLTSAKADVNARGPNDETPLYLASLSGHTKTAAELLESGADQSLITSAGRTPFHAAVAAGHLETAKMLLEKGADINLSDLQGITPLHSAASEGHLDLVKFLVSAGASTDAKEGLRGFSPLQLAQANGRTEVAEYLSSLGRTAAHTRLTQTGFGGG